MIVASALSDFSDGVRFIFQARESSAGTVQVGGLNEVGHMAANHLLVSSLAVAVAIAIAMPIALVLGHKGRGEFLAISTSNIGRAVPSLAIIAFFVAFLGTGFTNLCFALILLAIPPILTNTYVAVRRSIAISSTPRVGRASVRVRSSAASSCRLRCRRSSAASAWRR